MTTTLSRLILITHPMAYHQFAGQAWARPWIADEARKADAWWKAAPQLPRDAALAIVGCYPANPPDMDAVCRRAAELLGDRCVVLREPEYLNPDYWKNLSREDEAALLGDLREACLAQRDRWNKEEMETWFHSRRCVARLRRELDSRGMRIDPDITRLTAWGVEFEGCVAKYALAFRGILGLRSPAELDQSLCLPGAKFMLSAKEPERIELPIGVTIHLSDTRLGPAALFLDHLGTMTHPEKQVLLPADLKNGSVRTKQGGRLWPEPRIDRRGDWPYGVREVNQPLVTLDNRGLTVPACAGMVYRLAKAPAYLIAPRGMRRDEFRAHLLAAKINEK